MLKRGDTIRVVAPSYSLSLITKDVRAIADRRFQELGLTVTFGKHVGEMDGNLSSSIDSRVADLHDAYADDSVNAIFAVIGGYNCNQLLSHLDWDLIKKHPKPLIGYSDTTALQNALFAKTGHTMYSGPAYSTFGQELYFDYTLDYFRHAVMSNEVVDIRPSNGWTDDQWYRDQANRKVHINEGWLTLNEGQASGTIIGGNLGTFSLLFGTDYMPDLAGRILFLEEDECQGFKEFDRLFQALLHQKSFSQIRGIVIGRFQEKSAVTPTKLRELMLGRPELEKIPILANVDFGHTSPIITFPIGGMCTLNASNTQSLLSFSS